MTRAQRPAPSVPREFHFPAFQRLTLPNGMKLVVAPMHRLPVVTVIAVVDGGAMVESGGIAGVSDIVAHALLEGTRDRTADELVMALERLGTSITASADWESTLLKMTVMSPRLEAAMLLLSEMLTAPRFDEQSVNRIRAERLSEIIQTRSEPRVLAEEKFSESLYAPQTRYAIPAGGSEQSVSAITIDDVRSYHARTYSPPVTTLILAGDITVEDARRLSISAFGSWTGEHSLTGSKEVATHPDSARTISVVARAGAQQSELRVGHAGVPRSVRDYFPIVVMNAVLGGLFSSRINLNLREVHGYTYGASSYFEWRRDAGPFVISSAVQSEVTAAAIREILGEIEKIRAEHITDDELTLATSYLAGVFPIRYETSDAVASGLASLVIFGLPDTYFTSYRANILGVTTAQVQSAARQFLKPEELRIVIVGNPEIIERQVDQLSFGSVIVDRSGG